MESGTSYLFSFRVVFFYVVTTDWIFDIISYVRIQYSYSFGSAVEQYILCIFSCILLFVQQLDSLNTPPTPKTQRTLLEWAPSSVPLFES